MSAADVLDEHDLDLPPASDEPAKAAEGSLDLRAAIAALEKSYIERALRRTLGNRAEAARLLGIARPQLYTKMKELDIEPDALRRG